MLMFLLAALLPACVLFWYVYSKDITPEPMNLVLKGFLYGALATFVSTFISGPLSSMGLFTREPGTITEALKTAFFGAAIPEETAKLLMLWLLLRKCKDFDERYDGIVYAAAAGLGFASLENVMYVAIAMAFLSVPGHFGFAVIMGYYYSIRHFSWNADERRGAGIKMWLYPVLLHGAYDTICFSSGLSEAGSILFTFILLFFCFRLFKFTRNKIIAEAVDNAKNSAYYNSHRDFYTSPRHENSYGKDIEYFYMDDDDSVDEQ